MIITYTVQQVNEFEEVHTVKVDSTVVEHTSLSDDSYTPYNPALKDARLSAINDPFYPGRLHIEIYDGINEFNEDANIQSIFTDLLDRALALKYNDDDYWFGLSPLASQHNERYYCIELYDVGKEE